MKITIEIPKIDDFNKVNKLAKQVHDLHVIWNPDLYIDVNEVILKDNYEKLITNKEIFIAKLNNEIVGYIIFSIKEKENPSMRYRKQLNIEAICVDEKCRGNGIGTLLLEYTKNILKRSRMHRYVPSSKSRKQKCYKNI